MKITFNARAIARTKWWEFGIRFVFGGAITAIAGLLAKNYGPVFGGLFLAFPAIFPASATLVESHEQDKKQAAGITHTLRGRELAAVDAKGATLGGVALMCFGLFVWQLLPRWNAAVTLLVAIGVWLGLAVLFWRANKTR